MKHFLKKIFPRIKKTYRFLLKKDVVSASWSSLPLNTNKLAILLLNLDRRIGSSGFFCKDAESS